MNQTMRWEMCQGGLITFDIHDDQKTKVTILSGRNTEIHKECDCYADALKYVCKHILAADEVLRFQEKLGELSENALTMLRPSVTLS